jgi:hypothetical protein
MKRLTPIVPADDPYGLDGNGNRVGCEGQHGLSAARARRPNDPAESARAIDESRPVGLASAQE